MTNKILSGVCAIVLVYGVFITPLFAQTTNASQTTAERIAELLQKIRSLQEQIIELQAQVSEAVQLTRQLTVGATGEDVKALQELLASDPDLYPEGLVTGYFGSLTEKAVARLQARFGISQIGTIGPVTQQTINEILKHYSKDKGNVFWKFFDDEDDSDVDRSLLLPGMKGVKVCHRTSSSTEHTIAIGGPAIQAHMGHGDRLGSCGDSADDGDDEDEDDATLALSKVSVRHVTDVSARIVWDTNEDADSTVWFSTSSSFSVDDDRVETESDNDEVTSHDVTLTGLTPRTTYYFKVGSKDSAGTEVTSRAFSFTTLADTEGADISKIETDDITATSVTIQWKTEEASNSMLWYATTTGFSASDVGVVATSSSERVTEHKFVITNLASSTTYYFMVASADAYGNKETSNEKSFTTHDE